jgi:hypothetical protein
MPSRIIVYSDMDKQRDVITNERHSDTIQEVAEDATYFNFLRTRLPLNACIAEESFRPILCSPLEP